MQALPEFPAKAATKVICDIGEGDVDFQAVLSALKAAGYDGIEIAPWDLSEILGLFGTPAEFTAFAADHGIEVSGMFHGADNSQIATMYDEVLAAGKQAVDTLKAFGGKHLNMCPARNYHSVGPLDDEALKNSAKAISAIGEYAVDNGIQVGLHNEFFCAVNKENHRKFLEMTDPRYVFYCLDTAQIALMGDDVLDFYDTYAERICTFHLKDTASHGEPDAVRYGQDVEICDDGHRWFWEPGEGELPLEALWKLVKKHGFKGRCTIEDDGAPDYLAAMALSSYYVNNVLGKIYR